MTRCSTGRATQKYKGSGTDLSDILETQGDIIYADSTLTAENLSISGTPGDVLKVSVSGVPEWGTSTSQWVTSGSDISYITGNVGIGTTTPDANLHVNGNAFVSSNLALGGVLSMGTVNVVARHTLSAITATGNLTPNTVIFDHPTTAFVTTANVGIGTSTPTTALDVVGTVTATRFVGGGSNGLLLMDVGRGDVYFENNSNDNASGNGITLRAPTNPGTTGSIFAVRSSGQACRLWVGQDVTAVSHDSDFCAGQNASAVGSEGDRSTYNFIVKSSGRVGIGTTTPFQKLTIDGDVHIPSGSDVNAGSFPQNGTTRHLFFGGISRNGSMLQAKTAIVSTPWTQYGGTQSWGRHGLHFCVDSAGDDGNVELGQTKMCINYLGNVGIGSWSTPNPLPQTMASVHGGRVLEGRDATGFEFIAASSDTTNAVGQFNGAFLIKNMDDDGSEPHYIGMAGRGNSTDGSMDLSFYSGRDNYENNTPQMVIDNAGRVGIGTTTPGYTLDVTGDINLSGSLRIGGVAQTFGGGGSGSSPWVTSGNDISYSTGNVAVDTNTFFVDSVNDRVGIGTTSPTEALQVYGDGTDPTYIRVVGRTSNRAGLILSEENADNNVIMEYDGTGTGSGAGNYLAFYSGISSWATKGTGLNFVPENGRVGIGTPVPGYDLDVAGDINCTGSLTHRAFAFYARASGGQVVTSEGILSDSNSTITVDFDYTPAGSASFNGFRSSGGPTNDQGTYFAPVSGIYHVSCKVRLPDANTDQQEIQWYIKRTNGNEDMWESFEMWISPADAGGRRATMSSAIVKLVKDEGIFPRADGATVTLSRATFGGHFLGTY